MQLERDTAPGAEILSYVVASGDMRFIEINERTIFLRDDPRFGKVIRGEVPGCGQECFANLSQILLESIMSSGDSRESDLTMQAAARFGERLGGKLSRHFLDERASASGGDSPLAAMAALLNSMDVSFESEQSDRLLRYRLEHCPLRSAAAGSAMSLWVVPAHRAFVSLVKSVLRDVAPEWQLRKPGEMESDAALLEIELVRM